MTGLPLAFQVWDAVGWTGQAVFTWRVIQQWLASEKAKRSVVPSQFWAWSLLGTALLLVYSFHRRDPVFLVGFLVNSFLYGRNWVLTAREGAGRAKSGSPLLPVLLGLGVFLAVEILAVLRQQELMKDPEPLGAWLIVGFAGQALWSSRFVVQWYASERLGRSVMPASFFWMSLLGGLLLLAYAIHRVDWVMMAAFALNPIPYARNLVLIARATREERSRPAS